MAELIDELTEQSARDRRAGGALAQAWSPAAAIEQLAAASGLADEVAAVAVAHPLLGQVVVLLATPNTAARLDPVRLLAACRASLPGLQLPALVDVRAALPRTPDGKVDRRLLAGELAQLFAEVGP